MAARVTAFLVFTIVAATLVAGLIVGAQRDTPDGPVDLIVFNGKVFAGDEQNTMAEAFAVRGNQILKVGSNRDIKRLRRRQTTVVDAHGGAVVPGFTDSHVHLLEAGLLSLDVNLTGAGTIDEVGARLSAYADEHPELRWIRGRGWRQDGPYAKELTKDTLDRLIADRPVYLLSDDGRSAWVNSKTLDIAGVTARSKAPHGGVIVRDPRTGSPTGILEDGARSLVEAFLPSRTREEQLAAIRAAVVEASRSGVTGLQSVGDTPDQLELYDILRQAGELRVRVYSALGAQTTFDAAKADALDQMWKRYPDDPVLKTGAVSIQIDPSVDAADLSRTIAAFDARGWQVLVETEGDASLDLALSAFEQANRANQPPARGRRHRVEHATRINAEQLARVAALDLTASVDVAARVDTLAKTTDPGHASAPGTSIETLADAGVPVVFASNWPELFVDPRRGLHAAVTGPGASEGERIADTLVMSVAQAVRSYTSIPAYASFDEQRRGTLAPGMLADVVILSADIFSLAPEKLMDASVTTTIFDGRIVYSSDAENGD